MLTMLRRANVSGSKYLGVKIAYGNQERRFNLRRGGKWRSHGKPGMGHHKNWPSLVSKTAHSFVNLPYRILVITTIGLQPYHNENPVEGPDGSNFLVFKIAGYNFTWEKNSAAKYLGFKILECKVPWKRVH